MMNTRKKKLSRLLLPEQVAETLREMIIVGDLPWGKKVPVTALAAQLEVSPTPLREALKVLASENLVELLPNRGARVCAYTKEDARDLFEVIAGLESLAARLAATRITPQELCQLQDMHQTMHAAYERHDKDAYFPLNSAIHDLIVDYARNPVLSSSRAKLMVRANRGRFIAIADPYRWREALDEHDQLMDAFERRDPDAAAAIWQVHLDHTGLATVKALSAANAETAEQEDE